MHLAYLQQMHNADDFLGLKGAKVKTTFGSYA